MIKKYLFIISVLISSISIAQSVSTTNETVTGNCDGTAIFADSYLYSSWNWKDSTTIIQPAGDTLTSLCAGTYILEYTDTLGTYNYSFTINSTISCSGLSSSTSSTNETVPNACDGSATVNPTGGTAPYIFSWSNSDSTQSITGLCAGSYTVTITDSNACSISNTVTITTDSISCSGFTTSIQSQSETSAAACNGYANANPSGGTTPYTFSWSNSDSTQQITNLCSSFYYVTVTDANNCTYTDSTFISTDTTGCSGFNATTSSSNTTGNSLCDGSAATSITGGSPTYTYSWSNGENTPQISNLCAGIYTISITDANNCNYIDSVLITSDTSSANINPIYGYVVTTDETASNSCDGFANVIIMGGTTPYSYNHSDGTTSMQNNNLCAGFQSVNITDALGDIITLGYLVSTPANTVINITYVDSTIIDTIITETVTNCAINYASVDSAFIDSYTFYTPDVVTVVWSIFYSSTNVSYITTSYDISGSNGVYNIELTLSCPDKTLGNFLKTTDQIIQTNSTTTNILENLNDLKMVVYPNPFNDNITIIVEDLDTYKINIFDMQGKLILKENYPATNKIDMNLKSLPKGQYIIQIQNQDQIITKKIVK